VGPSGPAVIAAIVVASDDGGDEAAPFDPGCATCGGVTPSVP